MSTPTNNTALVIPIPRGPSFGDLLVQVPFLYGLKSSLGAERVVVIATHAFAHLHAELGITDEVQIIPNEDAAALAASIHAEDPRWLISLRGNSLRSSLRLRRGRRRGHTTTAGWRTLMNRCLLDVTVPRVRDAYYAEVIGRILEALGGTLDILGTGKAIAQADPQDALPDGKQRLVCMPAGRVVAKQWGAKNYIQLGQELCSEHPNLVPTVIAGPQEQGLIQTFVDAGWHSIMAPHPRRLAALCQQAACIVANDCGPGHLAQMSGKPMVTLFHNDGNHDRRRDLIQLWWFRRPHSRAITTSSGRPITDIPIDVVAEQARQAMTDASRPAQALWWQD
jgi:ADP-heptose:LPS heptosyltransferase